MGVSKLKAGEPKYIKNKTDGTLGLAPLDMDPKLKNLSLLYQMKRDGYIDQMVFSVYMKMSDRRDSHIKLGGFDEEGALNGVTGNPDFKFLRTAAKDTWRIKMLSAGIFDDQVIFGDESEGDEERFVQFELAYPYTYIPMKDFKVLAKLINTEYGRPLCASGVGKCQFKTPCDEIEKKSGNLQIILTDESYNRFHVKLDHDSMFVDASKASMPPGIKCFIPIIG